MAKNPSILLIDGTSYIFRAFYALPPLMNGLSEPTGALYGFCAMIHKLLQDYPRTPMVLFFDAGGKNWRHQLYADYKSHRQAPPPELIAQIKALAGALPLFGMPIVQQEGVEADDFIAVVARRYSQKGLVLISSPDKDFTQLIGPNIMLEQSIDSKRYDKEAVELKYGVGLEQIIDYFALLGDSSDGIPGVPKIGPKTAQKLLKEHSSLDALLAVAESIPGAVGRSIQSHKEQAILSRDLFRLATEAQVSWPKSLSQEDLPPAPQLDVSGLLSFYERYELKSLFPRVKNQIIYPEVMCIESSNIDRIDVNSPIAVWCADGLFAWAQKKDEVCYTEGENAVAVLKKIHTLNTTIIVANYAELRPRLESQLQHFEDLSLMSYVLEADKKADWQSIQLELFPGRVEPENDAAKAAWLLMAYEQLSLKFTPELRKVLVEIDYPLAEILYQMQENGICLDASRLTELSDRWSVELAQYKQQIVSLSGRDFNINSSKQLREVLFEELGLKSSKKTPKGELSTKEDVLVALRDQHPVIDVILSYRQLEKLRSTYTMSLVQQISPKTGRLHTTFDQKGTITGRLASSQPNLQNIPVKSANGREIRSAFCAPEGKSLVFFDYSQIELRLMAHMSQDPVLLQSYLAGADIHRQTAMLVLGLEDHEIGPEHRQIAKTVNFGLLYGMSAYGLSEQLQISPKKAQQFIDIYFERFPRIKDYMQSMRDFAKEHGYVTTLTGRKIPIKVEARRGGSEHAWRAAINGPLQGTASDLIKKAMIDLQPLLKEIPGTKMLLQVHDELIFECDADKAILLIERVKKVMQEAMRFDVPIIVESKIAQRWE